MASQAALNLNNLAAFAPIAVKVREGDVCHTVHATFGDRDRVVEAGPSIANRLTANLADTLIASVNSGVVNALNRNDANTIRPGTFTAAIRFFVGLIVLLEVGWATFCKSLLACCNFIRVPLIPTPRDYTPLLWVILLPLLKVSRVFSVSAAVIYPALFSVGALVFSSTGKYGRLVPEIAGSRVSRSAFFTAPGFAVCVLLRTAEAFQVKHSVAFRAVLLSIRTLARWLRVQARVPFMLELATAFMTRPFQARLRYRGVLEFRSGFSLVATITCLVVWQIIHVALLFALELSIPQEGGKYHR